MHQLWSSAVYHKVSNSCFIINEQAPFDWILKYKESCTLNQYKKRDIFIALLVMVPPLTSSGERCRVEMSKLWYAAMQMDCSLPCCKGWHRGNIASIFSLSLFLHSFFFFCKSLSCLGSLESKCMIITPPLFIATLCLTISYRLKFMTSSHCRNWFSMLWFPAAS